MSGSNESLDLAMIYLFLALIHHARYGDVDVPLSPDAGYDEILIYLFRGLWRAQ